MKQTPTKPSVTPDTVVAVTIKGHKHTFQFGEPAAIRSWANSLEDLTGYRAEVLIEKLVERLTGSYGLEIETAAGDLCPIRFLVTKH